MFPHSMPEALMTAEDLLRLPSAEKTVELVRGRLLVREPPGTWHGRISANLAWHLESFIRPRSLGAVFGQDTGFRIGSDPDTVRGPDMAFLSAQHLHHVTARGFAEVAPEIVAEVLSPDDRPGEVPGKVADWLAAGVKLVWVIDPLRNQARVYRPDGSLSLIEETGALDGEDVLPGFTCTLKEIVRLP